MHKRGHHHHHHHHYYGDGPRHRDHAEDDTHGAYTRNAGSAGPGPNRHGLYRNIRAGKVAGVCAGFADYFGWRVKHVRLALILATIFFFPVPAFLYVAAAVIIKPDQPISARYNTPDEERFWRTYSARPKATLSELKHRFRAIDARIAGMEKLVTSNEFRLRREFRDLEGDAS